MKVALRSVPWIVGLLCGLAVGWWAVPALLFEERSDVVPFSHALHTGGSVGMDCSDCHRSAVDGDVVLPAVDACADCHESIPGVELTLDDLRRQGCGWDASLRQPEGVRFSHAQHVDLAGLDCAACHGDIGASTAARSIPINRISGYPRSLWGRSGVGPASSSHGMEMSDCAGCHEQREVVQSCLDCHR